MARVDRGLGSGSCAGSRTRDLDRNVDPGPDRDLAPHPVGSLVATAGSVRMPGRLRPAAPRDAAVAVAVAEAPAPDPGGGIQPLSPPPPSSAPPATAPIQNPASDMRIGFMS